MGLSINARRICLFATMFVFAKCAVQRHDLKFGIQFRNFENQSRIIWDFSGLDTCRIIDLNLVFSDQCDWYLEGESFPLPENLKNSLASIDLIDYWDGSKQDLSRIGFSDGDSLSCIGRIKLSDEFDSYLIRYKSKKQWTKVVKVYLFNFQSNEPLSIISLSQYAIGSGFHLKIYTLLYGTNSFVQESVSSASDIVDSNQENKKEVGKGQKFIIDDNGRMKVL